MLFHIEAQAPEAYFARRSFLIEAKDRLDADAKFRNQNPGLLTKYIGGAKCMAAGPHSGELSVWQGQDQRTAVLCQHHGENPPSAASALAKKRAEMLLPVTPLEKAEAALASYEQSVQEGHPWLPGAAFINNPGLTEYILAVLEKFVLMQEEVSTNETTA